MHTRIRHALSHTAHHGYTRTRCQTSPTPYDHAGTQMRYASHYPFAGYAIRSCRHTEHSKGLKSSPYRGISQYPRMCLRDFVAPAPKLHKQPTLELRDKILALTSPQAKRVPIGKSTYHYLRERALGGTTFSMYSKTRSKLEMKKTIS